MHDDCLGTALEALYEHGVTELFYQVASQALKRYGIEHRFVHLDSTTFSLHGAYEAEAGDEEQPQVISITRGFSKDHAPELNQVVLSMMTAYGSSIPLWLEALSGNANDKVTFRKSIREYRRQFKAKEQILALERDQMDDCGNGYRIQEVQSSYGDVAQRWLLVFSEKAYERENATMLYGVHYA